MPISPAEAAPDSGRWHHAETPIVYCSDHPASPMLAILVHVDLDERPSSFQLLSVDVPDGTPIASAAVPEGWRDDIDATRDMGSAFIAKARDPILAVPSVIVPHGINYLLNPTLLDGAGVRIESVETHAFDSRLLSED